jgi:mRNA-degrading endonuclease RelE of RelBE toxin-antitoxin system
LLSVKGQYFFIKSRIVNSKSNKGKSAGYRIYFFVDRESSCVYLLDFYPKTGKYGKADLTKAEEK